MKKQDGGPCSTFIMLGFLGFIAYLLYKMVQFFLSPAGLNGIFELLKGLGLCLGVGILIFLIMAIYLRFAPKTKKSKLVKMSKDYAVRINHIEIDTRKDADSPDRLPDFNNPGLSTPVYMLFTITNYGLQLSPIPASTSWGSIPSDNTDKYRIFSIDRPGSIILPTGFMFLYYILYRWEGNIKITNVPIDQPGYYGELPHNPGSDFVEIVITNTHIVDAADLQNYIPRQQTLRFRLITLDQNGNEDGALTRELYEAIYNHVNPPDTSYEDYYGY